ncbi:MAG: nuclear transport factor 2 family protein [Kibdelosporangium sp.]
MKATHPEDLARMFVQLANAGDAAGLTQLYEPDAVLDFPAGNHHIGHDAIRTVLTELVSAGLEFTVEKPVPTLISGDIALTGTRPADGTGGRTQVARRRPDGTWLRVLDRPETPAEQD